ncbi:Protein asteroid 1 [Borealophlyctis nickersoniae]|nr:Protein asteroid 1 [Borealophlyctis nickersoniae]
MGITGLASLVEKAPNTLSEDISWPQLSAPQVAAIQAVVDGNAFVHFVARQSKWLPAGGHRALSAAVQRWFLELTAAGLAPVFVFDGPLPKWKFAERITRDTEKIHRATTVISEVVGSRLASGGVGQAATLLPPLAVSASIDTLRGVGAKVLVAEGEADQAVVLLARQGSCVLSLDSDFLIHDIDGQSGSGIEGCYIPFDTIHISKDPTGRCLRARAYRRARVANFLGISPSLMPALAALVGCDAVGAAERDMVSRLDPDFARATGRHDRIKIVAKALRSYNGIGDPFRAIENMLDAVPDKRLASEQRVALLNTLHFAVSQYARYDTPATLAPLDTQHQFIRALMVNGQYSHKLVEVAQARLFWCSPYLEDTARASAWDLSRNIRSWVYAIVAWSTCASKNSRNGYLAGEAETGVPFEGLQTLPLGPIPWEEYLRGKLVVTEYLRRGGRLAAEHVHPKTVAEIQDGLDAASVALNASVEPFRMHPENFHNLPNDLRETLYLHILQANTPAMRALPISMMPLAGCARSMILECAKREQKLANYELMAWLASAVKSVLEDSSESERRLDNNGISVTGRWAATRLSVHRIAQIEAMLFSALLLAQSLLHPRLQDGDFSMDHWKCLDGPEFHRCMELTKGGASMQRLMSIEEGGDANGAAKIRMFEMVRDAVVEGLEGDIETVIEYGGVSPGTVMKRRKEKKSKGKGSQSPKRTVAALSKSSNMFEFLSSGCSF